MANIATRPAVRWWREYRGSLLFLLLMLVFRSAWADWVIGPDRIHESDHPRRRPRTGRQTRLWPARSLDAGAPDGRPRSRSWRDRGVRLTARWYFAGQARHRPAGRCDRARRSRPLDQRRVRGLRAGRSPATLATLLADTQQRQPDVWRESGVLPGARHAAHARGRAWTTRIFSARCGCRRTTTSCWVTTATTARTRATSDSYRGGTSSVARRAWRSRSIRNTSTGRAAAAIS